MALRITEEERSTLKDEFLNDNQNEINKYIKIILDYKNSKVILSEKSITDSIFPTYDRMETIAGNILFTLATTQPGPKPLQSIAGSISTMMSASDSIEDRTSAMHTAMELLIASSPYTSFTFSRAGFPMIESLISNQDLITRNIVLPLDRPTEDHKQLGSFNWDSTNTDALNKLNKIPLVLIDIPDTEPEQPTGDIYSKGFLEQKEKCNKYIMRTFLRKEYAHKEIYFNWGSDYRGRMYSVGYFLSPQGNEHEKSMIAFANGEKLTFEGLQQYKKSIASAYSKKLAKGTDREKLQWFIKNSSMLHLKAAKAHEPDVFNALVLGWKQHLNGEEVTVPVEVDATCSFAQLAAVLLKSKTIAQTCNVINVKDENGEVQPQDLYKQIAYAMSDIVAERKQAKRIKENT